MQTSMLSLLSSLPTSSLIPNDMNGPNESQGIFNVQLHTIFAVLMKNLHKLLLFSGPKVQESK